MLIGPKFIILDIKNYDCLQCLLFAIIRKVSCFSIFLPFRLPDLPLSICLASEALRVREPAGFFRVGERKM